MMRNIFITIAFALLSLVDAGAKPLVLHSKAKPLEVMLPQSHDKVVDIATQMLSSDMQMLTGTSAVITKKAAQASVVAVQLDRITSGEAKLLQRLGIAVSEIKDCPDAFIIKVLQGKVYAVGSNGRGVAYALLELSRMAGVSPWVWWADNTPETVEEVTLEDGFSTVQRPAVERRGIFINDEDWSILPWSHNTHDPAAGTFECAVKGRKCKRIGAQTYKEVFKLLLRLRANMIWPAMHEYTVPFYQVEGAMEVADSCGIIIGTSHCEPLMRNNTTEWSVDERGSFNYLTNKEQVQDYWIARLKESAGRQNVYTMGMRGIHDGSMEGPKTLDEKTFWLQRVIDDQREMLAKYVNKDLTKVPQAFVPYKEVLEIYENGLRVPDDITLIWCDDNYGYLTRLPDAEQQKRSGGHGLYYHLSYWGRPHSYLWHTTTQPGLIFNELREAYNHNVRKQWIFNVHDPKAAAFDLELALDLAWKGIGDGGIASVSGFETQWFAREFGESVGQILSAVAQNLNRLTAIRRPEFMGWNQVELDKKKYPTGKSPIADTEFSFTEFGGEADKYLTDYRTSVLIYDMAVEGLPIQKRNAAFALLGYKLKTSALFAERMLEAQRARSMAVATDAEAVLQRNISIAKALRCRDEIRALTMRLNTSENGKWAGLMNDHPQDYPVYGDVPLPYTFGEDSIRMFIAMDSERENILKRYGMDRQLKSNRAPYIGEGAVSIKAWNYDNSSVALTQVEQLGHSMSAVPLPKGEWAEYSISVTGDMADKDALIRVAVLPTQANDRGDIRFGVSIDGSAETVFSLKEPYRSERWKVQVLRQQALRTVACKLAEGEHKVRIRALDDHIVLDQLMFDTKPERKFYSLP